MYLSERMNKIISSFPHRISEFLFDLDSWDDFGSLGCRIGEGLFFCVSILSLGSVGCGTQHPHFRDYTNTDNGREYILAILKLFQKREPV